jgi:hypothetical protein
MRVKLEVANSTYLPNECSVTNSVDARLELRSHFFHINGSKIIRSQILNMSKRNKINGLRIVSVKYFRVSAR